LKKFKVILRSGDYFIDDDDIVEVQRRIYALMALGRLHYQKEFKIIDMGVI